MFINFPISVQFVPWCALKLPFSLPWNPRHTPQVPPDQYHILWRLPYPIHIQSNLTEQNFTMKPQCPEDQFVLLNTSKCVQRVLECYIIPEIIKFNLKKHTSNTYNISTRLKDENSSAEMIKFNIQKSISPSKNHLNLTENHPHISTQLKIQMPKLSNSTPKGPVFFPVRNMLSLTETTHIHTQQRNTQMKIQILKWTNSTLKNPFLLSGKVLNLTENHTNMTQEHTPKRWKLKNHLKCDRKSPIHTQSHKKKNHL